MFSICIVCDTNLFISPEQVQSAWGALKEKDLLPRGFMFRTIDEEGKNGVNVAQGFNKILHIRPWQRATAMYLNERTCTLPRWASRRKRDTYRQQHACLAGMEAASMAQGVDCWKSVATPPWTRIDYNLA
jgi:hypothetical protein